MLCVGIHVLCMFIQDKRAHLHDHMGASVEDHLELTWSSLVVAKQELDNMKDLRQKFHQTQEVVQKLTDSMADSHEEVQDLTLAVKRLEKQNVQQKMSMEYMERKLVRGMLTESMADSRKEVRDLKLAIQNLEKQNSEQKKKMEDMAKKMAKEMKSLEKKLVPIKAHKCDDYGKAREKRFSGHVSKITFGSTISSDDDDTEEDA